MAQVIDGSKKNFNTSVVGASVTVIAQYNVRDSYAKQYYMNSRVYEFGNRPVWGENFNSFVTPLVIATPSTRLLTSSTVLTLNNSFNFQRIQTPSESYGYSTSTKLFVTGTNSISIPVNFDGGGYGLVSVVPAPTYLLANIYGVSLVTTGTYAFAIEQLPSTVTSTLSFGKIITASTNSNTFGSFGNGDAYVYTVTNSSSIVVLTTSTTIAPINGTILGITPTGATYTPPTVAPIVADILVVAGGGSGGNHNTTNANGGGGGGGVLYATTVTLTGVYDVIVGAGGVAIANATAANGNRGGNSSFGIFIAQGGGGGQSTGVGYDSTKNNGGSGGGAAYAQGSGGSATQTSIAPATGYGNAGGTSGVTYTGAGGGGAGGAGVAGSASAPGGDGGRGLAFNISGSVVWYAGGGGGGGNSSERAGDGYAGGGRGSGTTSQYNYNSYPAQGTVNSVTTGSGTPNAIPGTGGGGGAGSYWAANGGWSSGSGAGGSGVVIVRYPGAQRCFGGTVTTAGTYTVHTFTQTGVTLAFTATAVTTIPTFRTPVVGPWIFTITNLTNTVGLDTRSVISVLPRSASLGVGNQVYISDTGTSSITVTAFGGTSPPTPGFLNAVYATGEIFPNPTITAVTATSTTSWTFNIIGLQGTANLSVGAVITATSITGSFGTGTTVAIKSITTTTQIVAYATGTSAPIAGTISGITLTGATATLPAEAGDSEFTTPGTYTWVAPTGITSVSVVAVGGGGGGGYTWSSGGGGGGGLGWKNNITVVPGQSYTVVVGAGGLSTPNANNVSTNIGGTSYFISTATVAGYGGGAGGPNATVTTVSGGYGGGYFGDGGGRGGNGAADGNWTKGGAGAGGYSGQGADSPATTAGASAPTGSGGGAAAGYYSSTYGTPAGGGVGIYGRGADGTASGQFYGGGGGSGGAQGTGGEGSGQSGNQTIAGGAYGGGGGGSGTSYGGGPGGKGAVRIIWGSGRSFPVTSVTQIVTAAVSVSSANTGTKSSTIGGPTYSRRSLNDVASSGIFRQNHVPATASVVTTRSTRPTLQRAPIYQTGYYQRVNVPVPVNNSTTNTVSSGTKVTRFITSSTSALTSAISNTQQINPDSTTTYIYGVTAAGTSTWGFRIYNLSSSTVASLTSGTIITVNTNSNSTGNFGTGNTVSVFSITDTTSIVALADGGTIPRNGSIVSISVPGGTFTYTPPTLTVDLLVVGGGGSGGNHSTTNGNGGGGAGGLLYGTGITLAGGAYTVTVGAGGAAIPNSTASNGNKGSSSTFGIYTAQGGGGGGSSGVAVNQAVMAGGSGGGYANPNGGGGGFGTATQTSYTSPTVTGYGNAGGNGAVSWTGGGGGGAGGAGVAGANSAPGGDGGRGLAFDISGSVKWYAGGGGGGGNSSERAGDGYAGGGRGTGSTTQYAYNNYPAQGTVNSVTTGSGTPNAIPGTGGGGGAGSYWAGNGGWSSGSGAGGSGIVIVRYLGAQKATGGGVSSNGTYTIHTFTATGVSSFVSGFSVSQIPEKRVAGVQVASYARAAVYTSTVTDYNIGTLTNITSLTGDIGPGLITSVLGSGPWTIQIDQLRSTTQFTTGTLVHATPLGGSFGIGNIVAVVAVNSGTSITCLARNGTVAPTTGTIIGVYSRGPDLGTYIGPVTSTLVLNTTTAYSVNFRDSVAAYLQYGHSTAFNLANTPWTAECWIRPDGNYANYNTIFCKRVTSSGTTSYEGYLRITTGVISFYNGSNYESTYTLTPMVWSHCAWVYTGNTLNIYVNGVSVYSVTISMGADNTEPIVIGTARGYSEYFLGYLTNFRLVKGIAVYTGTFTPPLVPLETTQVAGTNISAISTTTSTVLLTLQTNNTFIDRSLYNTSTTISGSPVTSIVSPFSTATAIAPYTFNIFGLTTTNTLVNGSIITATTGTGSLGTGTTYVYSINNSEQVTCISSAPVTAGTISSVTTSSGNYYGGTPSAQYQASFNASNQYVTIAATSALEFGANNFTIEFWWYPTSTARQALYHGSLGADWSVGIDYSSIGTQKIGIWASSNGTTWNLINSDAGGNGTGSVTPTQNAWNHVAFVRNGTNWRLYINGTVSVNITGLSGTIVTRSTYPKVIGMWFNSSSYPLSGYISNFRIVTNTALYTAAFTPPTIEATTVTNTAVLTLKSSSFIDLSSNALTISPVNSPTLTQGSLSLVPAQLVYQYQVSLNGSSQYLTTPTAPFAFGTNNFTVEAWVYLNAMPTSDAWPTNYNLHMVVATIGTPNLGDGIGFIIGQTKLIIQNNDTQYASTAHGMTTNTWYHLAYVRNGNNFYFYVNGVAVGSVAFSLSAGTGSTGYIGCETGQGAFLNGSISNLRIVNGTAVYTTAFTKPSNESWSITNTTLLTLKSSTFLDQSFNAYTITPVGSPTMALSTSLSLTSISGPAILGPAANYTSANAGIVFNNGFGAKSGPAATVVTNLSTNTELPNLVHINWATQSQYGNEILWKTETTNGPYDEGNRIGNQSTQPVTVYTQDGLVNYGKTRWIIPELAGFNYGGGQAATAVTVGSIVPSAYARTDNAKAITSSSKITSRISVPVGLDTGGVGTIGTVLGSGPWTFDITGLTTTVGFKPKDILSVTPRVGSFGVGNNVFITAINTSSYSISCLAYGGTVAPTSGLVNSVYPTSDVDLDPTITAITTITTTSWSFTVLGLKGTTSYTAANGTGTVVTVTTASNSSATAGAGNTVVVSSINSINQITCYVTGTSTPIAGLISGVVPTASIGGYASPGETLFINTGTYTWVAPFGVTSVSVVAVGGGGGGGQTWSSGGGGGGGLGWRNNIPVNPGQTYTVVVGAGGPSLASYNTAGAQGGTSYFISTGTVAGYGSGQGGPNSTAATVGSGGGYFGDGGGRGGNATTGQAGGAGAGGYSGAGGDAGANAGVAPATGSGGGAAGGYYSSTYGMPGGGGVGLFGRGADGTANGTNNGGGGGSGGANGSPGEPQSNTSVKGTIIGGAYGGGGGGSGTSTGGGRGGHGAVRIIWGLTGIITRSFPVTNTGTYTNAVAVSTPTTKSTNIGGNSYIYDATVYTNRMPYPKSVGIDRLDTIVAVDIITDDAVKIKLYAFNNLSSYSAGSKSVTNSLTGSENFYVAGTGTEATTNLTAYWF